MKNTLRRTCTDALLACAVLISLAAFPGARADGPAGMPGRAPGAAGPVFDPGTVETLRGEVEAVDRVSSRQGMHYGVHLRLRTADGVVPVHLGPGWFVDNQDHRVTAGDGIEFTGSRVTVDGETAILAQTVRVGDLALTLRDATGRPAWAGWRRASSACASSPLRTNGSSESMASRARSWRPSSA